MLYRTALLAATISLLSVPAWAGGYLADYSYGGYSSRDYLSDYTQGGYNPPSRGARNGYSGPSTPISRKHRSNWNRYVRNLPHGTTKQQAVAWYNPYGIKLGLPAPAAASKFPPCGNYFRMPEYCNQRTTPYQPVYYSY